MRQTRNKAIKRPTDRYLELIQDFPLRRIRTKAELAAATGILDRLFGNEDADAGETDYLDVLSDLVDSYERRNDPNYDADATGLEVLRALMEEHEMSSVRLGGKARHFRAGHVADHVRRPADHRGSRAQPG